MAEEPAEIGTNAGTVEAEVRVLGEPDPIRAEQVGTEQGPRAGAIENVCGDSGSYGEAVGVIEVTTWVNCPVCGWIDVQAVFWKEDHYDCPSCESVFSSKEIRSVTRPEGDNEKD
jgi:hypothetical protein